VTHPVVDGATVLGALSVYLLIGLFFASVYGVIASIGSGPLFAQALGDGSSIDWTYFSFVTLTTVGFGDITARADIARVLAVSEALLGQIYLVTVVALLIGNIGRERRSADRNAH
jgi:voltage-gated potassium channel Kch